MTRRSFLEQTLVVAGAGLAAAQRRARAADSPQAEAASVSRPPANERIGLAVIGLHGRGIDHINGFARDPRVEIVALCDVDSSTFARAQSALQKHDRPAARQYSDVRKLLEDKDVSAVSIATPNHWHALAGIWAMAAGRDAYVEKPVSHELNEGRRLEQARIKFSRICQTGTQGRSNLAHREAIQFIHDGGIGKVVLARGLCYKRRESIGHFEDSPTPPGVDYDLWLGPAPVRPFNKNRFHYNWHWNWDYGNGDIGNQGIHQMDIARWALNRAYPASVLSAGGRFGYKDDGQTPNSLLALFDYGDAKLLFEVRGLKTPPLMGITVGNIIYGTQGFVAFPDEEGKAVVAFDNQGHAMREFRGTDDHFKNFIDAVRSRSQADLHAPILEGHVSTALCHLANISYRLGEPTAFGPRANAFGDAVDMYEAFGRFEQHLMDNVDEMNKPLKLQEMAYFLGPKLEFNGNSETFKVNARANAMRTREYRAPFIVPERI